MPKGSLIAIAFLFLSSACVPAATPVPSPTATQIVLPTRTAIVAENPPACAGANMVYHTGLQEVLMMGCTPGTGNRESVNVIWGWNGENWRRVTEDGPPMRVLGGAAYDEGRDAVVLYGGYSLDESRCEHETWEWDGESWLQKETDTPQACDHLKMVYDASGGRTLLFGGGDENQNLLAETWAWNGDEWTLLSSSGPTGRAHFGLVYDDAHKQTLLYGGYADRILDDFWIWRDDAWQPIDFPGPGPLSHAGMAMEGNALVIFGGASSTSTFSSLSDQTWKLTNGAWTELTPVVHPSKRGSPAMVYDPEREKIVLYGGFESDRTERNDTWEWDGQEWRCILNCQ